MTALLPFPRQLIVRSLRKKANRGEEGVKRTVGKVLWWWNRARRGSGDVMLINEHDFTTKDRKQKGAVENLKVVPSLEKPFGLAQTFYKVLI